ncbi:response regulator [Natronomonas salina]|uniref:response regulator n=1 Tax=Natronomonas salina TaxID=1710540 RepID=UPI0015B60A42|nr:response regulator [Natronomonas salina]QLD90026.1 response regulator [Natronomonas salina]
MTGDDDRTDERVELLLIEPNPGDTRLFTESFRDGKLANALHTVPDGETALDFLHQRGAYSEESRPDLVLLEPRLPGKSGMDVLSELRGEPALADVPVVVLTSSGIGEEIVRSHGLDADHYLQKPVEPDDFIEFVRSVEDFWLAIVQRKPASD